MKLRGRDSYIGILMPETVDFCVCEVAGLVGRIRHPG